MKTIGDPIQRVLRLAAADEVSFVSLQFSDILGSIKQVGVPVAALATALSQGVTVDGSAVDGFTRLSEASALLWPDPATYVTLPPRGSDPPAGSLLCDLRNPDGTPFAGCCRHILQRVVNEFSRHDYEVRIAMEVEFFLFHAEKGAAIQPRPRDQAGYMEGPLLQLVPQAMLDALVAAGCGAASLHHEVAPGQYSFALSAADPVTAADRLMLARQIIRDVARRHGLLATFMPKPLYGVNGSGLHLHQWILQRGQNLFQAADEPYGLSGAARHFAAGQLARARACSALTNSLVNSYKRLVPGYEAPVYIAWSEQNRSPYIRIPKVGTGPSRIELRGPDPACNPYLALAAVLAAGLDGLQRALEPPPPINRDLYELSARELAELGIDSLPGSLGEAVEALMQDQLTLSTLGNYTASRFIEAKQIEWDLYRTQVHRWEIEQYLTSF